MYQYEIERPKLFTESGQVDFLKVRDNVNLLLDAAGAIRMTEALRVIHGDGWRAMAMVDRLVELNEIVEITNTNYFGQDRVFVRAK